MLISFSVTNWKSFRDEVTLDMRASDEEAFEERVIYDEKFDLRLLPVAAIYGANASGKSNLWEAMVSFRAMITQAVQVEPLITYFPFLLDQNSVSAPTYYSIQMLIQEKIFEYSLAVSEGKILSEKLSCKDHQDDSEQTLLWRQIEKDEFDISLSKEYQARAELVRENTGANQPFLTNATIANIEPLRTVYSWIKHSFKSMGPHQESEFFDDIWHSGTNLNTFISKSLANLDTGITGILESRFDYTAAPDLVPELIEAFDGLLHSPLRNLTYDVRIERSERPEIFLRQLIHSNDSGHQFYFSPRDESSGTVRLLHLLPTFYFLTSKESSWTFVIDEIAASLHPNLATQLLEMFLNSLTRESKNQLIFTTHNLEVFDQSLLRRDEIWLTEKDTNGVSELFSLRDFDDLKDTDDLRTLYKQGRLGGVPRL